MDFTVDKQQLLNLLGFVGAAGMADCMLFIAEAEVKVKALDPTHTYYIEYSIEGDANDPAIIDEPLPFPISSIDTFVKYLKQLNNGNIEVCDNDDRAMLQFTDGVTVIHLPKAETIVSANEGGFEVVNTLFDNYDKDCVFGRKEPQPMTFTAEANTAALQAAVKKVTTAEWNTGISLRQQGASLSMSAGATLRGTIRTQIETTPITTAHSNDDLITESRFSAPLVRVLKSVPSLDVTIGFGSNTPLIITGESFRAIIFNMTAG